MYLSSAFIIKAVDVACPMNAWFPVCACSFLTVFQSENAQPYQSYLCLAPGQTESQEKPFQLAESSRGRDEERRP